MYSLLFVRSFYSITAAGQPTTCEPVWRCEIERGQAMMDTIY
ncbi:hypothetical protein HMPREF0083_05382 [Aneurinibacillus aneurinilyticus ATCC 12856]|uniref:Uncharacterized protein n=1 Tax=Aneurinibacillus aneurinilyticus ATCC 12856 TaxID=649747 RepID=U1Y5K6_ANEAE|nr:hypothetical protein HMPREF0083_05382 [Aneurinibacillus aneurinilyticus ATCC 12856]